MFDVNPSKGLTLIEIAEGFTVDDIKVSARVCVCVCVYISLTCVDVLLQAATGAPFEVASNLIPMRSL